MQAFPATATAPLTQRALGSVSRTFVDPRSGDLVGAFRYPGVIGHVGVLSPESGDIRRLTDIKASVLEGEKAALEAMPQIKAALDRLRAEGRL